MAARRDAVTAWRVKRAMRSLNWAGGAAIALAAFGIGFYLSSVRPAQAALAQLRAEVAALRAERGDDAAPPVALRPERQLDEFYRLLPAPAQTPEVLRRLYRNAHAAGLSMKRGDYRPRREAGSELLRYQIELPVRGSYPDVRRFLDRSLREESGLALDGIGFRKDDSGVLETQLRFTLFVRPTQ